MAVDEVVPRMRPLGREMDGGFVMWEFEEQQAARVEAKVQ